ncbi:MAG: hypothetical protein QXN87_06175 [Candidatus Bathyarchaeia archaeon]
MWIKIDKSLPWIELKGTYQNRKEAYMAAERLLSEIRVKVVEINGRKTRQIKALATVKH